MEPFTALFETLRAALDTTRSVAKLKTERERNEAIIPLQAMINDLLGKVTALNADHAAVEDRARAAERELRALQQQRADKALYQPHRYPAGGVVYRVKACAPSTDPELDFCAQCVEDGIKSVLQPVEPQGACRALKCHRCGSVVLTERIQSHCEVMPSDRTFGGGW